MKKPMPGEGCWIEASAKLEKGDLTHQLSKKLGKDFYTKYRDGLDYLTKAKELEPYMFVKYVPSKDSFIRHTQKGNVMHRI